MSHPPDPGNPPPVHRLVYRGHLIGGAPTVDRLSKQVKGLQRRVDSGALLTFSLFRWGDQVFIYYECSGDKIGPEQLLRDPGLVPWPGGEEGRRWVPMMDIFHFNRPLSVEDWQRREPLKQRTGRVIRLRPEWVSSYIFWHYQMQEEKPGSGDKYGLIAIHENLLFFYREEPTEIEAPQYPGLLQTEQTPEDWHGLMGLHFQPWEDDEGEELWRPVYFVAGV